MNTEFSIHPAAELFPMMEQGELQKLADDIKKNGLLEPIIICNKQILDGRNRLAACSLVAVEPHFADPDIGDPYTFVLSKNLHRRHLDHETRAWIAAQTMPQLMEEARKRQAKTQFGSSVRSLSDDKNPEPSFHSHKIAAELADVSPATIQRAWEVAKTDPELAKIARENKIAPSTARRALDDPELRKELLAGGDGRKPPVRRDYKPKEERVEQIRELAKRGYHNTQIAAEIGVGEQRVNALSLEAGIELPHRAIGKRHRIDVNRVVEETVSAAEGFAATIDLLTGKTDDLDTARLAGWIESLEGARGTLGKIIRLLKGVGN